MYLSKFTFALNFKIHQSLQLLSRFSSLNEKSQCLHPRFGQYIQDSLNRSKAYWPHVFLQFSVLWPVWNIGHVIWNTSEEDTKNSKNAVTEYLPHTKCFISAPSVDLAQRKSFAVPNLRKYIINVILNNPISCIGG